MRCEFIAALVVFLDLLLIDGPDLSKFVLVVCVLDRRGVVADLRRCLGLVGAWNGEKVS